MSNLIKEYDKILKVSFDRISKIFHPKLKQHWIYISFKLEMKNGEIMFLEKHFRLFENQEYLINFIETFFKGINDNILTGLLICLSCFVSLDSKIQEVLHNEQEKQN